jgi:hypothetical protein
LQRVDRRSDTLGDVQPSLVAVSPTGNRFAIGRERQQFSEWRSVPIDWSEYDRNDSCFAGVVPLHCAFHFKVIAVVRRQEVGADQQQDDIG